RDARELGPLTADVDHPRRRVHSDHAHARGRGRHGDSPGSDPELDDRAARRPSLLDVELDLLDDPDPPRALYPPNPLLHAPRPVPAPVRGWAPGRRRPPAWTAPPPAPARWPGPSPSERVVPQRESPGPSASVMSIR